jgi:hypothetical protein
MPFGRVEPWPPPGVVGLVGSFPVRAAERNIMYDDTSTRMYRTRDASTGQERATVIGLFHTLPDAEGALEDLVREGYDRERISVVASNAAGEYDRYATQRPADDVVDTSSMDAGEGAAAGGGIGAAIGGVGGILMGLGLLAIPGVGPALAAGPLISGLIGAGIGGIAGGITGALVNSGVPEDRAGGYAEGVRRGGTLVVVETTTVAAPAAEEILVAHGALDIEERMTSWESEGWTGFDSDAEPYTADEIRRERERWGSTRPVGRGRGRR